MKKFGAIVIVMLVATAFGCKDSAAPKSEVPVESASEAARNDSRASAVRLAEQKAATDEAFEKGRAREERQRNVDLVRAVSARWEAGLNEARLTPRSDIAGPIKKLQAIKADAETIGVDDCAGSARNTLVSSMVASIEAFSMFQKEKGESGDTTTQKVQQATDLLRAAQSEMSACLSK